MITEILRRVPLFAGLTEEQLGYGHELILTNKPYPVGGLRESLQGAQTLASELEERGLTL